MSFERHLRRHAGRVARAPRTASRRAYPAGCRDDNRREAASFLRATVVDILLATVLDISAWQVHGVVRVWLLVPAVLFSLVSIWMLLWVGFVGWALLSIKHRVLGAVAFGLGVGVVSGISWWNVSDRATDGVVAGVGTAILTAIAVSFAPRGRRS